MEKLPVDKVDLDGKRVFMRYVTSHPTFEVCFLKLFFPLKMTAGFIIFET
jgi:hypothetical protein